MPKQARVKQVSRDARPPGDATQAPAPHVPQHTRNTGSRAPVHASHLTNWISSTGSIDQLAALVDDHAHELTSIHINAAFTRLAGLASEAPSASNRRPSSPSPHPSARQQQRAGSNSAPSRAPAHQPPSHAQNSAQEHLASSLLQLTTAQLPKLQPWQLANILHCCSKAGHKPSYSWTEKLLERLEPHIASLNTISLTNTLVSLAALDHKVRQPWMAKALAQVRLKAHTFEGHQLARVVHSVVQISPQQYHFTLELVAAARPRLKQLQLRMQVRMLHSVAKAAAAAASSAPAAAAPDVPAPALQHESLQELARSIIRQVGHLDAQDVAMVLWALAKLQQQLGSLAAPPAPLPAAATAGARPGPKLAVSRPAGAAAAAGAEQQEQQPGLHMKIMPSLPPAPKRRATQAPAAAGPAAPAYTQAWVTPAAKAETQASSTTSSAASKAATSKAAAAAALLLQAIAPVLEQAQQRLTDFNGQGLGMVCYAIARLNAKLPHSFWQQYMAAVQAQLARMNGQALANVIWGLGHSRATLSRRTLLSLDAAAAQQMQQMDAAGLVALLTGFRALGHRKPSPAFAVAVLATARKQMPGVGIRELVAVLGACHWMGMGSRVDAGLLRLAAGRICQLSGHSDSRSSSVERLGAAGLAPGAMCGVLLVLARCGAGKQWLDAATGAALQGSTLPLLQSASGSQLCVLLYALARMAAVNQARWLAQWASAAAAKLSMCSAADLATVLAGLALVEAGPSAGPLVHAVLVRARGKLPYMTSRQLVTVAWALARLQVGALTVVPTAACSCAACCCVLLRAAACCCVLLRAAACCCVLPHVSFTFS